MQWTDEGIVLGVKRHGEANAILDLMTRAHGRRLGMVRGGRRGGDTVEPVDLRAAATFAKPHAIYGLTHLTALMRLLPERDPHEALYALVEMMLGHLEEAQVIAPLVVRIELQLLSELGFGLDLAECAAPGTTAALVYVSPKSGRG